MVNILIITLAVTAVLGRLTSKVIYNPITIFNSIWLLVISLYQLRLSKLQSIMTDKAAIMFLIMIISFDIGYYVIYLIAKEIGRKTKVKYGLLTFDDSNYDEFPIVKYFKYWCFIEIIETIYSGGFPILWKIIGSSKTYFDFGIPSVHGFMNAYGLVLLMLVFYQLLRCNFKSKKLKKIFFLMIICYFCMITRQVIISMLIEIALIYVINKKKIPWAKYIVIAFIGIILFGIIGNVRTGYSEFIKISMIDTKVNALLVGFVWVYMYLTMTVANINKLASLTFNTTGISTLASIYFPSIIANMFSSGKVIPNYLVTSSFNVSGFFCDFYVSYGYIGIIFVSLLFGGLGAYYYNCLQYSNNLKYMFYYAIYLQIIVLSFFYNQLFYLPSGFQLIIIAIIFSKKKINIGAAHGKDSIC